MKDKRVVKTQGQRSSATLGGFFYCSDLLYPMFVSRKVVFPGYPAMLKCRETDPCLPRMID